MWVRFLGGEDPLRRKGNPLQYCCLENSMGRGAWRATVHGAAESDTAEHTHAYTHMQALCTASVSVAWVSSCLTDIRLSVQNSLSPASLTVPMGERGGLGVTRAVRSRKLQGPKPQDKSGRDPTELSTAFPTSSSLLFY